MIKTYLLLAITLIAQVFADASDDEEKYFALSLVPLKDSTWRDFSLKHDYILFDFY